MSESELTQKAKLYALGHSIRLQERLGDGSDGIVWKSDRKTAVKVFQYQKNYRMEISCYQRLSLYKISRIEQFAVPRLVWFDDDLLIIEMTIVTAPCLIDFGKAYLDEAPDHSLETLAERQEHWREIWEDRYDEVDTLVGILRYKYGIFYQDPSPGNIKFEDVE